MALSAASLRGIGRTFLLGLVVGYGAPSSAAEDRISVQVGAPAPRFRLRALDGTAFDLADVAYSGAERRAKPKKRPVLLDFFRTDCGPCRMQLAELQRLHARQPELEIIVVALLEPDDGRAKLEQFLANAGLPFLVLVDDTDYVSTRYLGKAPRLPTTVLIDAEGVVRATAEGLAPALERAVAPLLGRVVAAHPSP